MGLFFGTDGLRGKVNEELTQNIAYKIGNALSILKEPCEVTLTSDSKYLVDAISKGWLDSWRKNGWRKADRSDVLNVDLWQKLIVQLERHKVTFVWVHGHAGHEFNERCDVLATTFADSL